MSQRVPAVVGLYFRESGRWRRIAEFRLAAAGHVTFRAVDPVEGLVARVWYHQGVDILGTERTVLPEDGIEFLRALLQPFGFRDYRFRDDSAPGGAGRRFVHGAGGHAGNGLARNGHDRAQHDGGDGRPTAWRYLEGDTVHF
ncbi:hypothetical protein [Nocardia crassostreae]|uniref:hypothetical protein n=1 Tax=Nocardia crassostreae TaxID=53428 RepID=UPI00082FCCF5|nr:hypothetical protein [Nocardia crassostreae]